MVRRQRKRNPRRVSRPGRKALEGFFDRLHAYERPTSGRDVIGVLAAIYKCLCLSENGAISVNQGRKLANMYSESLFEPLDTNAPAGKNTDYFVSRSAIANPSPPALARSRR
jgi:hypothetical protein